MIAVPTHKDLMVWKKSVVLANRVYAATRLLPSDEGRSLGTELRRCALSVPSNIAEGAARGSRGEYVQFLHFARSSLAELETQMIIAVEQSLIPPSASPLDEIAEVGRLLTATIRTVSASARSAHAKACAPLDTAAKPRP